MNPKGTKSIFAAALLTALTVNVFLARATEAQDAVRLAMEAFDTEAQIEVRDLEPAQAEAAIRAALAEINTVHRLLDIEIMEPGGIAYLQANAGKSVSLDPRVAEILTRDLQYCFWSSGAYSPLGGDIEKVWRLRDQTGEGPDPRDLRTAVISAECDRLKLESSSPPKAAITPGSTLSMFGVEKGFAIDKAIEVLLRHRYLARRVRSRRTRL